MKRFLLRTFCFALLILMLSGVVELLIMHRVKTIYTNKRDYMIDQGDKLATLIIGHSQSYMGLNPELMGDSIFNAALFGQRIYHDKMMLEKYIDYMPNLKTVIWPITDFFWEFNANDPEYFNWTYKGYHISMMNKYFSIPPDDGLSLFFWPDLIWSRYQGAQLLRLINTDEVNCNALGWEGRDSNDVQDTPNDDETDDSQDQQQRRTIEQMERINTQYACELAKICRDHDVRLVVLTLPCHKIYTGRLSDGDLASMYSCIEAMKGQNPAIEYYNYLRDTRFDDDDFFDKIHLSRSGAEKFSKIVKDEVL